MTGESFLLEGASLPVLGLDFFLQGMRADLAPFLEEVWYPLFHVLPVADTYRFLTWRFQVPGRHLCLLRPYYHFRGSL